MDEILAMIDKHIARYDECIEKAQAIIRHETNQVLVKSQRDSIAWCATRRAALELLKEDIVGNLMNVE